MIELSVSRLNKRFGGNHVLKDVSFDISGAEMIGLIGPNGAGKTTLTNVLDGAVKPNSGTVYLNGTRIDQLPSFEVAKAGLGRTFQVTRSFRRMTVLENLYVPAMAQGRSHKSPEVQEEALEVLDFLTMAHLRNEYARALSGGQQKLLELGRLLMLMCVSLVILAQRRHMLLEMRVSWMLIFLRQLSWTFSFLFLAKIAIPAFGDAAASAGRILETCQAPIH